MSVLEVVSLGAGIQSTALAILNTTGRVTPRADLCIFADPGAEMPHTYEHLVRLTPWLAERGLPVVTVAYSPSLEDWTRTRSTPLPILTDGGLGHRQCTRLWKVAQIQAELRRRGGKTATVQLGISYDESHRMHDSPASWITHRWPLVNMKLTRDDCRAIIREAGLPEPGKSACFFCPFQSLGRWRMLAAEHSDLFERAVDLERVINERRIAKGQGRAYLANTRRPLAESFTTAQTMMEGLDESACGGFCFV